MAPTPITATHRVVFSYTVGGFTHKAHMYCDAITSGDSSGFDLVGRVGTGNVGFSLVPDQFFNAIAIFYKSTDTTFIGADLEERIGVEYIFLVNVATTVAPAGGSAFQPANGFDLPGKSTTNKVMHFYLYEGAFGPATKTQSYASQPASVQALIDYLFAVGGGMNAADAWNWRKSRGDHFSDRWLSLVIDSNQKLRRLRHIS